MPKHINLAIAQPCSQDLDAMPKQGDGWFCTSCQKHVADYSFLSDGELARQLASQKGQICGRFSNSQLNRNIPLAKPARLKLFPAAALATFFAFLTTTVIAGNGTRYTPKHSTVNRVKKKIVKHKSRTKILVKLKVPLAPGIHTEPFAVKVFGNGKLIASGYTDSLGLARFRLPRVLIGSRIEAILTLADSTETTQSFRLPAHSLTVPFSTFGTANTAVVSAAAQPATRSVVVGTVRTLVADEIVLTPVGKIRYGIKKVWYAIFKRRKNSQPSAY